MSITVGIVEDDPIVLEGLSRIIRDSSQVRLAGVARTGAQAMAMAREGGIDVYLVDLGLPDMSGVEVIARIMRESKSAQCMVLSAFGDQRHLMESLSAGATGYVLKDEALPHLVDNIVRLHNGAAPLSPVVAKLLVNQLVQRSLEAPDTDRRLQAIRKFGLAPREVEVLDLLAQGLPIALIATKLTVSSHTVNQHLRGVYRKLGVHSRAMAVAEARASGILGDV